MNPQIRPGFSLLEMAMASTLVVGILVPALAVVRDAMAMSREVHRRGLLANYAVRVLEDRAAWVSTNWTNTTSTGDFSADGHPDIRYTVTTSDDPGNGGLVNRLMHMDVTVYDDVNANDALDAGELLENYRTKVAKLNSYENELQ